MQKIAFTLSSPLHYTPGLVFKAEHKLSLLLLTLLQGGVEGGVGEREEQRERESAGTRVPILLFLSSLLKVSGKGTNRMVSSASPSPLPLARKGHLLPLLPSPILILAVKVVRAEA